MSNHDPAFLWETEALRQRRSRRPQLAIPLSPGWVTLRQAHESTNVPIDTLRKWGRQGSVPSMVVESEEGLRRLVRLENVIERAQAQGRDVPAGYTSAPPKPPPATPVVAEPDTADEAPPPATADPQPVEPQTPPGTMIVPIEAWDKMLMQLGNLHDAGQQLAEARERAAKAETEARFLKERLSELRTRDLDSAKSATHPDPDSAPATPQDLPQGPAPTAAVEPVWEYALRRWRVRRKR